MRVRAAGIAVLVVTAVACQAARPAAQASPQISASASAAVASPTATPVPTPTPSISAVPQSAQCGQRITTDFVLANDMTCTTDAFVINAHNVTLDLGGQTLT